MRTMLLLIGLLAFAARAQADTRWHWESPFSTAEQAGLRAWIEHTMGGMTALFGSIPGTFEVHFHRREDGGEAVPWGETYKGGGRHVHFFVDTAYPWSDFRKDWTAPHELSHLLFPYLGEDSRWFSEGIASYLQYPIMYADGVLTWQQAVARYEDRFQAARSATRGRRSVVERSREGGPGGYIPIYWGGAAYFLHADRQLQRQRGMRLTEVIRRYSDCCYRPWGVDADGLIAEFDRLSGSRVFSEALAATVGAAGFPDTAEDLEWLRDNPAPGPARAAIEPLPPPAAGSPRVAARMADRTAHDDLARRRNMIVIAGCVAVRWKPSTADPIASTPARSRRTSCGARPASRSIRVTEARSPRRRDAVASEHHASRGPDDRAGLIVVARGAAAPRLRGLRA